MSKSHNFELLAEQEITELNSVARHYRHIGTGAELLSLINDDENKVFNITFRTPPADSTGLPHIMEHAVLAGSRRYPTKEPFVELLKGSMKTFVNAMTFADQTSYPVASTNLQDFYNLIDVYLDAVFYPLITADHLAQEGWHYELEHPDATLKYKGVVFNEMKGAYSSPENVLARVSKQVLFPDTPYRHDSGGDPEEIPDLTYDQFQTFHRRYYHPSNARIFFYGDDDPDARLRLMDRWLRDFGQLQVDSEIPLQPPLEAPRRVTVPYSVDGAEDAGKKAYVQLNWLLPEAREPELLMALSVLSYALVSTPASPLRKALIDSDLGEQLTGGGLGSQLRQLTFAVGLKGVQTADVARVESLIQETLESLASDGLEPEMVEAAVNTIEFSLRENNTGAYPRGLVLLIRAMTAWLYDRDPVTPLAFAAPLETVKSRLAEDARYLPRLIRRYLVDNAHRVTVVLEPDPQLQERRERREAERLAQIQAGMDRSALEEAAAYTHALRRRQSAPDDPADLARIPRLTLADLDRQSKTIPTAVSRWEDTTVLVHDLPTNGIVYVDLGFDLHTLPQALLPYVTLFGRALLEMGTEREDFVRLSQRIGRKTGGITYNTMASAVSDAGRSCSYLFLRGKATVSQTPDLLDILHDVLTTVRLDNQQRFRQMVLQAKASKEAGLVPGGHSAVNVRLRAHFDEAGWVSEQLNGISYLFFLRQLARRIEEDWPAVLDQLEQLRQLLIDRSGLVLNVTTDAAAFARLDARLQHFVHALPAPHAPAIDWTPDALPRHEGLTIPAQVNYVGKGVNLHQLGYEPGGSIEVISNILRLTYLWEKIRVQGGAYGVFNTFDRRSGVFGLVSYRDPNLEGTLRNYDGVAGFLQALTLPPEELEKGIIGAVSRVDAYRLPDAKGYTSMVWHLLGESDDDRQRRREEILGTTQVQFRELGAALAALRDQGQVVVLGSADAIQAANEDGWLQVTRVL